MRAHPRLPQGGPALTELRAAVCGEELKQCDHNELVELVRVADVEEKKKNHDVTHKLGRDREMPCRSRRVTNLSAEYFSQLEERTAKHQRTLWLSERAPCYVDDRPTTSRSPRTHPELTTNATV